MRNSIKRTARERHPEGTRHRRRHGSFETLESRLLLAGDVVMFNDHIAGPATHANTTSYATIGLTSGLLRDSETGATTSILLSTQSSGAVFENVAGSPAAGTDAHSLFDGRVDFGSQPGSSIALSGNASYTNTFSGLNPQRAYEVAGTAVRGFEGYTNRWTLVTLVGAESFTVAHSQGTGIVTAGLAAHQVALWTGENHSADQGHVVQWTGIDPGNDGIFQITSQQYLGLTPGVGTGSAATGSKGYGLTAVRLVERDPSFRVASTDPPAGALVTSAPTSYTVNFNYPVNAATVEAADLTIDGAPATGVRIVDSDTVQFTLPAASALAIHNVAIAGGAIQSSGTNSPLEAFAGSFAILSGSGVVINEIHYDSGSDGDPWEYVELLNAGPTPIDLSGWRLANAVSFTIPHGTILDSGKYLLVSQHPAELASRYGVTSLGPFDGRLSNDGETLELWNATGVKQDEVDYQLGFPWPTIGDVPGRSIQLINPAFENDVGGNWRSALVTPGATNTVFATNAPPQMRQVSHSPEAPLPGQDVTITMKVTDPEGVSSVTLEYQLVNPGDYIAINNPRYATSWTTMPMHDDGLAGDQAAGDGIYAALLPGSLQLDRRLVRYRVTAADALGSSIRVPYADDPQPNFAYFVYDAIPAWSGAARPGDTPVTYSSELLGSVATYHLITTRQAHVDSQFLPGTTRFNGYGGSDYLWHGALVYDGVVYDHIRFRARGGVWRYAMGKNMWKFDFNRGHDFEARDDYGNRYEVGWSKLNLSAIIQQGDYWHRGEQGLFESVGFKLFNLAGVEASNTNYVHFRIIENANENGTSQFTTDFQGLYLAVEQLDDNFLEEHDLPDGNLYKMENGTGVGGIGGESNNQGDYPQPDNSSDLIAFKRTYEGGPPETADWWKQNFNLDSYYNYRSIVEAIHHYDIGGGKNYFYYHNPETNQWETLPWDIDLTWSNNMFGDGDEPFRSRVLAVPEFALGYRNRMREIRDLLYNSEQVGLLVDEAASFVYTSGQPSLVDADRAMWDYNPILVSDNVNSNKAGHGRFYAGGGGIPATGSFAGMMQRLKNYAVSRGAYIDSSILTDEVQVPTRPTISYTGEAGFPLDGLEFTASAFSSPSGSSFKAMEWRIAEIYHPGTAGYVPDTAWKYEIDAAWESGQLTSFNSTLDHSGTNLQAGHTYRARVRMQDAAGRWSHWSAPVEFVATPPAVVPTLSITELHYHPNNPSLADESDQEFIEIMNISSQTIDLSGVEIADFAESAYVFAAGLSLPPGQRIVVARNPAVFTSIYGTGINLAPEGYGAANLSNAGETITLRDAAGGLIVSFTYGDGSPWPAASDGDGPSLEIVDPRADHTNPANWRASALSGGSPGWDGTARLAGDYDGSGEVDPLDYAVWRGQFGTSVPSPGAGADGNADGVVDVGDYVVWRNHLGAGNAASASAGKVGPAVMRPTVIDNVAGGSHSSTHSTVTRVGALATVFPSQADTVARTVAPRRTLFFSDAVIHRAWDQALLELVVDSLLPWGNHGGEISLLSITAHENDAAFDLDDQRSPVELPGLPHGFFE